MDAMRRARPLHAIPTISAPLGHLVRRPLQPTDTLEAVYRGGLRWWHEDWWRGRDTDRCVERDIDIPLATQCSYHRTNPTLPYTVIACRGVAGGNVRITAANMIE